MGIEVVLNTGPLRNPVKSSLSGRELQETASSSMPMSKTSCKM